MIRALAQRSGGLSQACLSALERLPLILAALDLVLVVRPRRASPEPVDW